ncbi:Rab-like protein 6 [Microtus ochrogaster]|uniref:Rab-like protein 6 n=1 Tax=Microtus ochrogaster TaxID=79684 RepID=A0A8J6GVN8_MICOH|nr:Rab-like protein 6 [Microtus ochrogaster]
MATPGMSWQQHYYGGSAAGAAKFAPSTPAATQLAGHSMDYSQDMHLKMSKKIAQLTKSEPAPVLEVPARVQNIEDFVPEDGLDRSFLEDTTLPKNKNKIGAKGPQQESDSDDGEAIRGNPVVAGFQDDMDIEDQPHSKSLLSSDPVSSKNISFSSEEEAEGPVGHPGVAPQQCSESETKWSSTKASHSQKKGAPMRAIPSWSDGLTTGSGPDYGSTKPPTDGTHRP